MVLGGRAVSLFSYAMMLRTARCRKSSGFSDDRAAPRAPWYAALFWVPDSGCSWCGFPSAATEFADRIDPQLKSHMESRLLRTPRTISRRSGRWKEYSARRFATASATGRFNLGSTALTQACPRRQRKTAVDFRAEQLLWARRLCPCCARGGRRRLGRFSPFVAVVAVIGSAVGGYLLRDYLLGQTSNGGSRGCWLSFPASRN